MDEATGGSTGRTSLAMGKHRQHPPEIMGPTASVEPVVVAQPRPARRVRPMSGLDCLSGLDHVGDLDLLNLLGLMSSACTHAPRARLNKRNQPACENNPQHTQTSPDTCG